MLIAEYSGIGSLNAHAINPQNAPGTATDALTSTAATTTVSGCLIFGQCSDADGTGASAGTGFTLRGNFLSPAVTMFSEDETQGTAGSVAATFTAGTGTNRFVTSMMAFTPGANAFGDLLGTLSVGKTSVTNPLSATGSVSVSVGDLIVAAYAELNSDTVTGVTDNLGNTYTAQNAGSAATAAGRAFYSRVTVAGTLTSVNAATTASTDDAALSVACFSGGSLGFASPPIDANPANTTGDVTSPFTCPATGTLAQAIEVVVGWMSLTRGQTNTASPSPFALAKNQASSTANAASSVCAALCFDLVSSTASSSPSFTCASGTFSGSVLGTMSFKQASPAPPAYTPYDPWPQMMPILAQ